MPANVSKMGGFLKSSFFSSLIFFNIILSVCFVTMIVFEGFRSTHSPKTEAIEPNPMPQSVSEETAQLVKVP